MCRLQWHLVDTANKEQKYCHVRQILKVMTCWVFNPHFTVSFILRDPEFCLISLEKHFAFCATASNLFVFEFCQGFCLRFYSWSFLLIVYKETCRPAPWRAFFTCRFVTEKIQAIKILLFCFVISYSITEPEFWSYNVHF